MIARFLYKLTSFVSLSAYPLWYICNVYTVSTYVYTVSSKYTMYKYYIILYKQR